MRIVLTVPLIAVLLGIIPAASAGGGPGSSAASVAAEGGYHVVTATGAVISYGDADYQGGANSLPLVGSIVDGHGTISGDGYWLAASDGGVFTYGDAVYYGSAGALALVAPVVGMAATASGEGYYLVASDGGVFTYGNAVFYGSAGGLTLVSPVAGIEPTPSGMGYWLIATDGGVFTYGDAVYYGGLAGTALSSPVVGMAANADGSGYWIAQADGTLNEFGSAVSLVDLSSVDLEHDVVSVVRTVSGEGVWMTTANGGVFGSGDAIVVGSNAGGTILTGAQFAPAAVDLDSPVVGIFPQASGDFELTLLHNNDGESQFVNAGGSKKDFGGIAHFATLVSNLRAGVFPGNAEGHLLVSSGDNFLAGTELEASFQKGVPWYDSIALDHIDYDAIAIGNHEFDFGPAGFADFINGFSSPPFLSANLDFSGEASLSPLVASGDIAKSTVVSVNGRRVGIVGATTPDLASISSPQNVIVGQDVAGAIQTEADALTARGVDVIIVISHLQNLDADKAIIPMLRNVDAVVAGGGDELLANPGALLVEGETPADVYPVIVKDLDGVDVPIVTTAGNYTYVGQLKLLFDKDGNLKSVLAGSDPVRVANASQPDAVPANSFIQTNVVDPVVAFQAGLVSNVIATAEATWHNDRGRTFGVAPRGKRTQETTPGNIIADAFLWQAQKALADNPGQFPGVALDTPIAIQNGGGIREDTVFGLTPPWMVTELNTFDILAFADFVTIVEDLTPAEVVALFEHAYAKLPGTSGLFVQVANMTITVDHSMPVGSRVKELVVDTAGTPVTLVTGGVIVAPGGTLIDVVSNAFIIAGGGGYPFPASADTTSVAFTLQQAFFNYLTDATGLGGTVTAAQYPEIALGGGSRITITP